MNPVTGQYEVGHCRLFVKFSPAGIDSSTGLNRCAPRRNSGLSSNELISAAFSSQSTQWNRATCRGRTEDFYLIAYDLTWRALRDFDPIGNDL